MIYSVVWLVLLILFSLLEAATVGLTSIWFAVGAFCALLCSLFVDNVVVQVLVFLVVSTITMLLVRPLAKKYFTPRRVATNVDRILGQEAIVTEDIDNLNATGRVQVSGVSWAARSEEQETTIPRDTQVRVLRVEGVKVIVTPVEKQ